MAACPRCGKENPDGFEFCGYCTSPLAAQPTTARSEERKVVSVLFCDLVGFTAASDRADPEDVDARIRPYYARLREEIDHYGGTLEKFIGDAVVAVFGAPVAHEDDAERAVRAGLRILEAIAELNGEDPTLSLQVRVGIDTGEAVVALGARPERGEGYVTGDVVNTASRLQGVAPVNAVAVSEQTYRGTERIFEWEPLEPAPVKGKAAPLTLWRPLAPRARFGSDVTRTHTTPLVGRELERPLLIGTFERAAAQRSCQLVTIVGEPGAGKSRMCAELFSYLKERPGLVRWRQGRCLPYGEGIAFWALGEIVKAECGILETDSPTEAEAKLALATPEDDPDRAWLRARLAPLVGAPAEPAAQEESFAAWRRFLEGLAADGPAVLVFEDLHWADAALLSFLGHLADWAEGVPLLLLCTARPELYEQHPTWTAGLRNATTINLAPLSDEETARLIAALLERAVLPAETQHTLLERAGGNPLFAEEFVRLLTDRGGLEGVEVPESVQALIAARLDTLDPDRKGLLQDAAVIGKIFWAGAVAEMGGRDPREVAQALHELARKELVRPSRNSSMAGEHEYGFWHLLIRDVCYQQIPRASRAARHRAAAAWLERKAGGRVEDLADVLAHHAVSALELSRAAGQTEHGEELAAAAFRYLGLAGERALGLDVERAEHNLARALALCPAGHSDRGCALERWAQAALQQNRLREACQALEQALDLHRKQGDSLAAGRTLTELARVLVRIGDPKVEETLAEALELLQAQPPGPELVAAHAIQAGVLYVNSAYPAAVASADHALTLAARLGLPEPAHALGYRGAARCSIGERRGVEEMRRALQLAVEQNQGLTAAVLYNNLAFLTGLYEGPQAALPASAEGIAFSRRRGLTEWADRIAAGENVQLAEIGRTEQALTEATASADRLQAAGNIAFVEPRSLQLRLLAEQGSAQQAAAPDALLAAARDSGQPQVIALAFASATQLLLAQANPRQAEALLAELDRFEDNRADAIYASLLPGLIRTALGAGNPALAARLVAGVEPLTPLHGHALTASRAQLAEAAGDHSAAAALHARAAEHWQQFGHVPERAYALLGQGRCLLALGDAGAEQPLAEARELFTSMGYKPALAEIEKLLEQRELAAS